MKKDVQKPMQLNGSMLATFIYLLYFACFVLISPSILTHPAVIALIMLNFIPAILTVLAFEGICISLRKPLIKFLWTDNLDSWKFGDLVLQRGEMGASGSLQYITQNGDFLLFMDLGYYHLTATAPTKELWKFLTEPDYDSFNIVKISKVKAALKSNGREYYNKTAQKREQRKQELKYKQEALGALSSDMLQSAKTEELKLQIMEDLHREDFDPYKEKLNTLKLS